MRSKKTLLTLLIITTLCMPACGNSGGSSTSAVTTAKPTVVEGIAAAGAPLTGTITVSDASYPTRKVSGVINQDGTFSVAVDSLTPPLLIKAEGSSAGTPLTLYSFAATAGAVQVSPLTNLLIAVASGSQTRSDLFSLYSSHNRASLQTIANNLPRVTRDLQIALQPILALYGVDGINPFTANHQGLDGIFDDVAMEIANGVVTLTNKTGNATIFSASIDNLVNGILTTANLPTPASYPVPGNARLTLQLSNLPSGTVVKRLKTTIRLPLGVTVDQGTGGVNSAMPSGSAVGAVVYPQPTLSATNNDLSLELSALDGFGNGEFLTLRCTVSYGTLTSIQKDAFTVQQSQLYGDIYKAVKIGTGTVTPATLVFPSIEGDKIYQTLCTSCHTLDLNDTVGRPSLHNKGALIPGTFATRHRGISLSVQQRADLQSYLLGI